MTDFLNNPLVQYYYIAGILVLYPLQRIFNRAQVPAVWMVLMAVPFFGVIFTMAALSFKKWGQKNA